jgi:hypothetical protein
MSVITSDCNKCIHKAVCKYKEEFLAPTNRILSTEIFPEFIDITISCKQYTPSMANSNFAYRKEQTV